MFVYGLVSFASPSSVTYGLTTMGGLSGTITIQNTTITGASLNETADQIISVGGYNGGSFCNCSLASVVYYPSQALTNMPNDFINLYLDDPSNNLL